jgi:hypothetical protein
MILYGLSSSSFGKKTETSSAVYIREVGAPGIAMSFSRITKLMDI